LVLNNFWLKHADRHKKPIIRLQRLLRLSPIVFKKKLVLALSRLASRRLHAFSRKRLALALRSAAWSSTSLSMQRAESLSDPLIARTTGVWWKSSLAQARQRSSDAKGSDSTSLRSSYVRDRAQTECA